MVVRARVAVVAPPVRAKGRKLNPIGKDGRRMSCSHRGSPKHFAAQ